MGEQKYDYKAVGERIRHRRMELNLTQAELAEKISRVPKYCADIERGYCGMSIETLLAFCKALEVSEAEYSTDNSPVHKAAEIAGYQVVLYDSTR